VTIDSLHIGQLKLANSSIVAAPGPSPDDTMAAVSSEVEDETDSTEIKLVGGESILAGDAGEYDAVTLFIGLEPKTLAGIVLVAFRWTGLGLLLKSITKLPFYYNTL
jgi:hypothetical protein